MHAHSRSRLISFFLDHTHHHSPESRSRSMDARQRTVICFLLVAALVLHANHNPAAAAYECKYRNPMMPFCKGWMCKAECWVESKLFLASVKEHRCAKGGIKGYCHCIFCGNHLSG